MPNPEADKKECAFCATLLPEKELGEFEKGWTYQGHTDLTRGWYICTKCNTWHDNLIADRVSRTWMKIKSRRERSCCGGGG